MEDASPTSPIRLADSNRSYQNDAKPKTSANHRRSLSGSILAKLPFIHTSFEETMRPAQDENLQAEQSPKSPADDVGSHKRAGGGAMAAAVRQTKGRKRKGSLRKTALLGTGKLRMEGRERRNSIRAHDIAVAAAALQPDGTDTNLMSQSPTSVQSAIPPGHLDPNMLATSPPPTSPDDDMPLSIAGAGTAGGLPPSGFLAQVPINTNPYASTTDDDDTSYFPPPSASALQRRRSANKALTRQASSPLSHPPVTALEDEWDYSETEWWGWVVLIVTWIVFVVGMGSCLDVWSWAWDVGETPYAPPELEDDPTLPIVGYYPALIILTAVMAWVWVVVAWVGMKYFRHAKVVGEEG